MKYFSSTILDSYDNVEKRISIFLENLRFDKQYVHILKRKDILLNCLSTYYDQRSSGRLLSKNDRLYICIG